MLLLQSWQCVWAEEDVVAPAFFSLCIWTQRASSSGARPQRRHHPPPRLLWVQDYVLLLNHKSLLMLCKLFCIISVLYKWVCVYVCVCVCFLFPAATSCMAVMSTSLVASLLLHRHRKVSAPSACLCVCWAVVPSVPSAELKSASASPSIIQEAHKQNWFSC